MTFSARRNLQNIPMKNNGISKLKKQRKYLTYAAKRARSLLVAAPRLPGKPIENLTKQAWAPVIASGTTLSTPARIARGGALLVPTAMAGALLAPGHGLSAAMNLFFGLSFKLADFLGKHAMSNTNASPSASSAGSVRGHINGLQSMTNNTRVRLEQSNKLSNARRQLDEATKPSRLNPLYLLFPHKLKRIHQLLMRLALGTNQHRMHRAQAEAARHKYARALSDLKHKIENSLTEESISTNWKYGGPAGKARGVGKGLVRALTGPAWVAKRLLTASRRQIPEYFPHRRNNHAWYNNNAEITNLSNNQARQVLRAQLSMSKYNPKRWILERYLNAKIYLLQNVMRGLDIPAP